MNNPDARQASIRYKRATLARTLLQEHIKGNLDSTVHWSWDVLDALPDWCAMNQPDRMQLQLISGAYLLAPAMQLWIDRRVIQSAIAIIGEKAFTDALAFNTPQAFPTGDFLDFENYIGFNGGAFNNNEQCRHGLHGAFEQAGNQVVKASLPANTPEPLVKLLCPESFRAERVALREGSLSNSLRKGLLSNSLCMALIERALAHINTTGGSTSEDPPESTDLTDQSIRSNLFNGDAVHADNRADSTAGPPL